MDKMRSALILEKNELMYLIKHILGDIETPIKHHTDLVSQSPFLRGWQKFACANFCRGIDISNINSSCLAAYTDISFPDERKALSGLMRKNIISFVENKPMIAKLFDFYIRKLLSAVENEIFEHKPKGIAFYTPGFVLFIEEHKLSKNHVSITAFQSKSELYETLKEVGEWQ